VTSAPALRAAGALGSPRHPEQTWEHWSRSKPRRRRVWRRKQITRPASAGGRCWNAPPRPLLACSQSEPHRARRPRGARGPGLPRTARRCRQSGSTSRSDSCGRRRALAHLSPRARSGTRASRFTRRSRLGSRGVASQAYSTASRACLAQPTTPTTGRPSRTARSRRSCACSSQRRRAATSRRSRISSVALPGKRRRCFHSESTSARLPGAPRWRATSSTGRRPTAVTRRPSTTFRPTRRRADPACGCRHRPAFSQRCSLIGAPTDRSQRAPMKRARPARRRPSRRTQGRPSTQKPTSAIA
jgi:hypothetical protein